MRTVLQRAVQHRLDQLRQFGVAEGVELQAQSTGVLPQRGDRVGALLAGPDGRDHERDSVFGEVQDECRRCRVEQLGVVDSDDDLPAFRLLLEHLHENLNEACLALQAPPRGDELAECSQRDAGRAARDVNPSVERAGVSCIFDGVPGKAGLADARLRRDHDGGSAFRSRLGDACQLVCAADQGPRDGSGKASGHLTDSRFHDPLRSSPQRLQARLRSASRKRSVAAYV